MKQKSKAYSFLTQTLIVLSLVFSFGCHKDTGEDEISTGGLIGKTYGGGIIAYVDDTGEHGLIAAPEDEPGLYTWQEALDACARKVLNGYSDWYLPDKEEMKILLENGRIIGGFNYDSSPYYYWTSTETTHYLIAWGCGVSIAQINLPKNSSYQVRAVRTF